MTDLPTKPPNTQDREPSGEPSKISSEELFRGARTLVITHAGEAYRLLITRNNRLILQK
jgi:hemin uptake protein HemP